MFDTLNLNSQASWFIDKPEGKDLPVLCVQQLEKDTIFIGMDRILTCVLTLTAASFPGSHAGHTRAWERGYTYSNLHCKNKM